VGPVGRRQSGPRASGVAERRERRAAGVVRGWCPAGERNRGGPHLEERGGVQATPRGHGLAWEEKKRAGPKKQ
jgi:hypothetical protein